MVVNNIKVYARLKKEKYPKNKVCNVIKADSNHEDIVFYKNEKGLLSRFRFNHIFDELASQRDIFDCVAKPLVASLLQGFNGTIFAYGQTGSGKTYTMTGSTKKYEERGIIPRCLQSIFASIEKTEEKPTLYVSYMEIYNEICYDLLATRDCCTAKFLEELPRVIILEDSKGEAHLRNLNVLPVSTEEEAMRLLFLGDTNRTIAETPINEYSSRSHCIFTIYVSSRPSDSKGLVYSKLNLVDLAGSERVYKSQITGNILNEAKKINLSLHFLQQVILALSESRRVHIPYRNSLMTFILKDSLAGNCLTVMLATLAVTTQNIQETISTCKFAQRVSLVKTDAIINQVIDPYQEILLLKNEVQELRKQLAFREPPECMLQRRLSGTEKNTVDAKLNDFLTDHKSFGELKLQSLDTEYCFNVFKAKIKQLEHAIIEEENKEVQNIKTAYADESNSKNCSVNPKENIQLTDGESPKENYYLKNISYAYQKAKILAATIDECQGNISYIREKLDVNNSLGDPKRKHILYEELKYQQNVYKKSLLELKDLKNETLLLEGGLTKAKAKLNIKTNDKGIIKKSIDYQDNHISSKYTTRFNCLPQPYISCDCPHNFSRMMPTNYHGCSIYQNECYHDSKLYQDINNCQKCNQFAATNEEYISYFNPHVMHGLCDNYYDPHRTKYFNENITTNDKYCRQIPDILDKFQNYDFSPTQSNHDLLKPQAQYSFNTKQCCNSRSSFARDERQDTATGLANNQTHLGNHLPDERGECFEIQLVPNKLDKSKDRFDDYCAGYSPRSQENSRALFKEGDKQNIVEEEFSNHFQYAVVISPPVEEFASIETTNYEIFLDSDSDDFKKFMSTVCLTGDEEIDKEICNFYRSRVL